MGLMSAAGQGDLYIPIKRQLSTDSTKFSAPYTGMAVLHPATKTMDVHLSCFVESVGTLNGTFDYFSLHYVLEDCGVKSIRLPDDKLWNGVVTPFGTATGTGTTTLMGRAGLVPVFTSATSGKFALGRMYRSETDATAIGAWPMNMANLILVGRGYTMDFYGLQYE